MVRVELDQSKFNQLIEKRAGLKLPAEGKPLEQLQLDELQVREIMFDVGRYLARVHAVELKGYGQIDEKKFSETGELVGKESSGDEFVMKFFDGLSREMDGVLAQEKKTGKVVTELSVENRELMNDLLERRPEARRILEDQRGLLEGASPRLLNGNVHMGSIFVANGKFTGLADWGQILIGDPVDDLAYFSVMPEGERWRSFVQQGWEEKMGDEKFEEKLHLYRLLESFRKIFTRYVKHKYLEDYPEPLRIAQQELDFYNKR